MRFRKERYAAGEKTSGRIDVNLEKENSSYRRDFFRTASICKVLLKTKGQKVLFSISGFTTEPSL